MAWAHLVFVNQNTEGGVARSTVYRPTPAGAVCTAPEISRAFPNTSLTFPCNNGRVCLAVTYKVKMINVKALLRKIFFFPESSIYFVILF